MTHRIYRECVIGAICKGDQVLVAERFDKPGSWQLPQGGIEAGETPDQAIHREMNEELAISHLEIIDAIKEPICYDFPPELKTEITAKYAGQRQFWFLLRLHDLSIDVTKGDGEFRDIRWTSVDQCIGDVVSFKREAYITAFAEWRKRGFFRK